jgi:hypothetical protein
MRLALALALALAALAAGCASAPPPAPKPATPTTVEVTSLADASSLADPVFMNESHRHDYWGGKSEVVVMDKTLQRGELNLGGAPLDWDFLPDGGHVVPQGTDKVTITVSWHDAAGDTHGTPELWVRKPQQHDASKVQAVESGAPVVLATTLADADVPHQQLSAWRFIVRMGPATVAGVRFSGDLTVKVVAHRGLDIPALPPHPDLWNGKDAIGLLDEEAPLGVWMGTPPDDYECFGSCPVIHRPPNGTVVPFDARFVEVFLRIDDPSVDTVALMYHAADSWNFTKLQPTRTDGSTQSYKIPVKGLMGDGPYATQSLWELTAYIQKPVEDGAHVGTYHISARALRG